MENALLLLKHFVVGPNCSQEDVTFYDVVS